MDGGQKLECPVSIAFQRRNMLQEFAAQKQKKAKRLDE